MLMLEVGPILFTNLCAWIYWTYCSIYGLLPRFFDNPYVAIV